MANKLYIDNNMDIGFFIEYDNQVIQLPVNPEEIEVTFKGNSETVEIIKLGEISLLKDRALSEIAFESFFPANSWFSAVRTRGEFKTPDFYKQFFERILMDAKPCRLIVTGIGITMKCSVEGFDYRHQGGDHEDAYYSLELKEYRDYQITLISTAIAAPATSTSNSAAKTQTASTPPPNKAVAPAKITKGCDVILNGRVHKDSYGSSPGKTFSKYRGKVNLINTKGTHPYHITTPDGGWLGWVTEESVVLA